MAVGTNKRHVFSFASSLFVVLIFSIPLMFSVSLCKGRKGESIDDIINKGLLSLEKSDWAEASYHFSKAIDISPTDPRARMGMAMAQLGVLFEQIERVVLEIGNIIVQTIRGVSPKIDVSYTEKRVGVCGSHNEIPDEQPNLNDVVFNIVDSNLLRPISIILENLEAAAQSPADWNMHIRGIVWTVEFEKTTFWQIGITGEVDRTDAILLSSVFRFFEAVLKLLLSVDIHLDVRNLARIYEFLEERGGTSAIQKNPRLIVMNILPFILTERRTFLGVEPKRGVKFMREDIPNAIRMFSKFGEMFYDSILGEQDPQHDDIIAYIREEETAGGKLGGISFPTSSTYFYDKDLSDRLGKMVATVEIPPPDLKYFFQNIANSLDGGRVKWGDIIEITSFLVVVILKTGVLDTVITRISHTVGEGGVSPTLISSIGSILNPGFISGIIKGIIPDQIQFSLKPIFERPVSIRDVLPAWTENYELMLEWECLVDSPNITPLAEDNPVYMFFCKYPQTKYCFKRTKARCNIRHLNCFWTPLSRDEKVCDILCGEECKGQDAPSDICVLRREQECIKFCIEKEEIIYPDGRTLTRCNGSLTFVDSLHFSDGKRTLTGHEVKPMPQDGIYSIMPYFFFQSPSFYGALYLNKDFLRMSIPAAYRGNIVGQGYQLPDNFELNVFIQTVGRNLISVLSQFGIL